MYIYRNSYSHLIFLIDLQLFISLKLFLVHFGWLRFGSIQVCISDFHLLFPNHSPAIRFLACTMHFCFAWLAWVAMYFRGGPRMPGYIENGRGGGGGGITQLSAWGHEHVLIRAWWLEGQRVPGCVRKASPRPPSSPWSGMPGRVNTFGGNSLPPSFLLRFFASIFRSPLCDFPFISLIFYHFPFIHPFYSPTVSFLICSLRFQVKFRIQKLIKFSCFL